MKKNKVFKIQHEHFHLQHSVCKFFINSFILNLSLIFAADTRMHPVLKGLGITDRAISFVVDSSNGSEVKSSRAQGSLAKGPTPPRPVAAVDAARESQPGVHGGGLRCTCANGVRQARVSRWRLCPLVSAAAR